MTRSMANLPLFLLISSLCFLSAAATGWVMALKHFKEKPLPPLFAAIHGVFALGGLLSLGWGIFGVGAQGYPKVAALFFVIAFADGFRLLYFHLIKKQRAPSIGVIAHAAEAVQGLVVLVLATMMAS